MTTLQCDLALVLFDQRAALERADRLQHIAP
jgi:hypothetical protein